MAIQCKINTIIVFWNATSCSLVDRHQPFEGISFSVFKVEGSSSTLKTEAVGSSEMHQTTRRHIPEDSNIRSHCRENLKCRARDQVSNTVYVSLRQETKHQTRTEENTCLCLRGVEERLPVLHVTE
jgi:hypothetical protein